MQHSQNRLFTSRRHAAQGDPTPGEVRHTALTSRSDILVLPIRNNLVGGDSDDAILQDHCPLRVVGHLGLIFDGSVYGLIRASLRDQPLSTNCWAL
ncbi:hypothetical protein [Embleya sp. NBC_00896]|uniref:hypothetical protein n=1 Tax=Embleya sp. NBC_00896 TaxID=2975961 RepID=UPI00386BCFCB|nr:hypothetical protein OG928_04270 [Embleya sp. NBC_00896]